MTQNEIIALVRKKMAHRPVTVKIFENCFNDTLENTVKEGEDGEYFMLTGDIPAMWLRDSTNQLRPYLFTAKSDPRVMRIILGVIKKQLRAILLDPYANAFNETANGAGHQTDKTAMRAEVWERKYEIDSLCYPVQLCYLLWKNCGETKQFDDDFYKAAETIMDVWEIEQDHVNNSNYTFERFDCPETDTLPNEGKGNPAARTGMTWSGFRPSDDRCVYGYLIPSEMFAVKALSYLSEVFTGIYGDEAAASRAERLAKEIGDGIRKYGVSDGVYAYETDGNGNCAFMDDANIPSLLSLPYLGCCKKDDPLYLDTRKFVLSSKNPYYFEGEYACGIGSPHTPEGFIWHIALAVQGLTSADEAERERILDTFERTTAGTYLMHEGFCKDDPAKFTRPWFSWANAVYAEFVLSMCGLEIKL